MSNPAQTPATENLRQGANVPQDASLLHPPFPKPAVSPGLNAPQPGHSGAEAFINAAAKHIIPDHPAPRKEDEGDEAEHGAQGHPQSRGSSPARSEREEEPIIGGTPLDELKTPGFERAGFNMTSSSSSAGGVPAPKRRETSETVHAMPKEQSSNAVQNSAGEPSKGRPTAPRFDSVSHGAYLAGPHDSAVVWSCTGTKYLAWPACVTVHTDDQVRMGTSALMSALNAMPWDSDEEDASSSSDEDEPSVQSGRPNATSSRPSRPQCESSLCLSYSRR
jgi:sterol 3beta-glucosyltransferase